MVNYKDGKIYTIRCRNDDTLIYVGSTTQPLYKRWWQHTAKSKTHPNILLYKKVNNEWEKWFIELYEEYPCENKEQLLKKEGEVIRLIGNLNNDITGRNVKEYYNDNKDKIAVMNKKNYDKKREDKLQQKKLYYADNIEKLKEKHKKYYHENKDELNRKHKQYYQRKKAEKAEQQQ